MTLRDLISNDATAVFLNTDEFAETITYLPHRDPGQAARSDRSVAAVVIRNQYDALSEDGGEVVVSMWEVHVANNVTEGITSAEINVGRDRLSFPPRDGKTATTRTITKLTTQDHGMLVLECR